MNRSRTLDLIAAGHCWDVVVVGGGATGLGIAVDAASRDYEVLLLEQSDFCKATSSRSTKLIHGGVRYLGRGDVSLVKEALRERGLLIENAPHLVHPVTFVLPVYRWWEPAYYMLGLKGYDWLSGRWSLGKSRWLSAGEVVKRLPTLKTESLRGGVLYRDAQFDDARLGISLARTAVDHGACLANYVRVRRLLLSKGRVAGAVVGNLETGHDLEVRAKVVINATGVFSDQFRQLDPASGKPVLQPSQGIHLVLDGSLLPGRDAMIIPRTDDHRVLFAIPWHGRTLVGTTDTPVEDVQLDPQPLESEVEFLIRHLRRYLSRDLGRKDILSVFAGLRPLVKGDGSGGTASLSRDHTLLESESGLVTVTGGKWTTYRKMAEEAVDKAAHVGNLPGRRCRTRNLTLHGWTDTPPHGIWRVYGGDARKLQALARDNPEWDRLLHPRLPYREVEVIWAVREEMARTVEDVLSRRIRALVLDARAALESAGRVAQLMGDELGWSTRRQVDELSQFREVAQGYLA